MSELVAQKGYSSFRGIVVGMGKPKAYQEGQGYKRLSFGVKTSPTNTIYVELTAFTNSQFVNAYNAKEKKSIKIEWAKRSKIPDGYQLIGVTVGDKDSVYCDYDAIYEIMDKFHDGDSVYVGCVNQYSEYNGKLQVRYKINSIYPTTEQIDFEASDFDPTTSATFNQEIVITDVEKNNEEGRLFVNAYVIEGRGRDKVPFIRPALFTVGLNNPNQKLVQAMSKQKFGTTMKVFGVVINGVTTSSSATVDDEWGDQPESVKHSVREMEIIKVDATTVEAKRYKERDFDEAFEELQKEKNAKEALSGEEEKESKYAWE